jgi:hypothetical protein
VIVSPLGCREIRDAQAVSYRGRKPKVPFENSRPGSWTAGVVSVPGVGNVTCVSIYGLMDELSEASVHRLLSEISPLFSDPRYKEPLLIGGDLNTSTQWPKGPHLDGDKAVLERIKAYGLVDCLEKMRGPDRLRNCRCTLEKCTHTWTRLDANHPALQVDYLFASPGCPRTAWRAAGPFLPRRSGKSTVTMPPSSPPFGTALASRVADTHALRREG